MQPAISFSGSLKLTLKGVPKSPEGTEHACPRGACGPYEARVGSEKSCQKHCCEIRCDPV